MTKLHFVPYPPKNGLNSSKILFLDLHFLEGFPDDPNTLVECLRAAAIILWTFANKQTRPKQSHWQVFYWRKLTFTQPRKRVRLMTYSSSRGESLRVINYTRLMMWLFFYRQYPSKNNCIAIKSTLIDLSIHQVFTSLPSSNSHKKVASWK